MRVFLLVITFALSFFSQAEKLETMPEWSLETESGETISSETLKGKPLVLHFWATWCPYCKKLQPGLSKLYAKYQEQGLEMVAISFNEDDGATPQAVLESRGHNFRTAVNGDKVAFGTFGVQGTPSTFFVYPDGKILGMTRTSDPDDPNLEVAVQEILNQSN